MTKGATGLPTPIERLIQALTGLPGIGPKSALRMALHVVRAPLAYAQDLATALIDIKKKLLLCPRCQNITETMPCRLCSDPDRDPAVICVVQRPQDPTVIEKSGVFRGLYHVLHGAIAPLDGVRPEDLKLAQLVERVKRERVREVILATDADVEGETTAQYIRNVLESTPREKGLEPIRVTRLASGIPVGSSLEYMDDLTVGRALEGRKEI